MPSNYVPLHNFKHLRIRFILITATALALIAGLVGLYFYNQTTSDVGSQKPDYTVKAETLYNDFKTEETAAYAKFMNKVVEVEGQVVSVQAEPNQPPVVVLGKEGEAWISCQLHMAPQKPIVVGEALRIRGICTGYLMEVVLTQCAIVSN